MKKQILAEIIVSGSELMLGQQVDTNSAWLSSFLSDRGITVMRHTAVGDDLSALIKAFKRGWEEHNLVLVTGGLGPTEDDLTRGAAAQVFGKKLELRPELEKYIRELFASRAYNFTENNLRQAYLPQEAVAIDNPNGSAPGFYFEGDKKLMIFLPGVPSELKHMMLNWGSAFIKKKFKLKDDVLKTEILKVAGLGESSVDARLGKIISGDTNPQVGILASPFTVKILITAREKNESLAQELIDKTSLKIQDLLVGHVYGRAEESLAEVAAKLLAAHSSKLNLFDSLSSGLFADFFQNLFADNYCLNVKENLPSLGGLGELEQYLINYSTEKTADGNDFRLLLTPLKDKYSADGAEALDVYYGFWAAKINGGQPWLIQQNFGLKNQAAIQRAAQFSLFKLWQFLAGFAQK